MAAGGGYDPPISRVRAGCIDQFCYPASNRRWLPVPGSNWQLLPSRGSVLPIGRPGIKLAERTRSDRAWGLSPISFPARCFCQFSHLSKQIRLQCCPPVLSAPSCLNLSTRSRTRTCICIVVKSWRRVRDSDSHVVLATAAFEAAPLPVGDNPPH